MPRISWNEIQDRAAAFASRWHGETHEKGESQSFWRDFLDAYGIDRRSEGRFYMAVWHYRILKEATNCLGRYMIFSMDEVHESSHVL